MTVGIKLLRKLQLGAESTAGSAVAASTVWRGMGVLDDQHETVFPDEDIGVLMKMDRSYVPMLQGALSMESVPATFEQLPYILMAGVQVATGVQDGSGSGYLWTFNLPVAAVNTVQTYTLEGGDNAQAEEMEYCFVEDFTLEGEAGQALMMSANWKGRQITKTSFTSTGVTTPDVEEVLFSKGKLYIDPVSGTAGTTLVSSTFKKMSLKHTTGLVPKFTAEGDLYFTFITMTAPEVTLDITFEHNSSAVAEKDAWIAQTPRQIRVLFEGEALTTAGTSYTYKTLQIDIVGKWQKFAALSEQDGNGLVVGTFVGRYNSTAAKAGSYLVVNELSALP